MMLFTIGLDTLLVKKVVLHMYFHIYAKIKVKYFIYFNISMSNVSYNSLSLKLHGLFITL